MKISNSAFFTFMYSSALVKKIIYHKNDDCSNIHPLISEITFEDPIS